MYNYIFYLYTYFKNVTIRVCSIDYNKWEFHVFNVGKNNFRANQIIFFWKIRKFEIFSGFLAVKLFHLFILLKCGTWGAQFPIKIIGSI